MPLAKLFVEGALEIQVLTPILQGMPVLQQGGSKYTLKPRARTERQENKVAAGYLRDRDFDFDPPADLSRPTVDGREGHVPFGWRWCRHEIENYLVEPSIVGEATGWPVPDVEDALRQAAAKIRSYEAARWTIGTVRRSLPPHYELKTRPDGLHEIGLPPAVDDESVKEWALKGVEGHRKPIADATDAAFVQASFDTFASRFDDSFVADVAKVLLWFSGKDVLAGIADWLVARGVASPGAFRLTARLGHRQSGEALELLPEWNDLLEVVRA